MGNRLWVWTVIGLEAALPGAGLAFHDTLVCTDCHAKSATADAAAAGEPGICLSCHDGGTAPDVMHGGGSTVLAEVAGGARAAGALNAAGDGDGVLNGGYPETSGHTIGSGARPPGHIGPWAAGERLTCKSCHDVHANGNYRNLKVVAGAPFSMTAFCAQCHASFHGRASTLGPGRPWFVADRYVRHPTDGAQFRPRTRATWERNTQPLPVEWRDGGPQVSCVTCHRAHGTRRPFGLVFWDRDAVDNGEDGAGSTVRSLCISCHDVDAPAHHGDG